MLHKLKSKGSELFNQQKVPSDISQLPSFLLKCVKKMKKKGMEFFN